MSKPTAISPDFEKLPEELKLQSNWVLWRYMPPKREGAKWRKVPFQPNGRTASTTDHSTWSGFSECYSAYASGGFDGVGYVFDGLVGADGLCYGGIDFDSCIVNGSEGKKEVHSIARARIAQLNSYTERSVSGTGFHCIVRTEPLERAVNFGGVEVYTSGRYFTCTGRGFGTIKAAPIETRTLANEVWAEQAAVKCTKPNDADTEPAHWFDGLAPEAKDEVIDYTLGIIAKETQFLEVGVNGGNNAEYYRLTIAAARSGAPHAKEIFIKHASNAKDADPPGKLDEHFCRCRDAAVPAKGGATVGTLLAMAMQHGADFSQWHEQAGNAVRYLPGNEQACREALDRIVSAGDLIFTLDTGLLVSLRVPNQRTLPPEAHWEGDLPATTLTTPADIMVYAEKLCWLYKTGGRGGERWKRGRPPRQFVADYLIQMRGKYAARVLTGISRVPRIDDQGQVHFITGYDSQTGLYHDQTPAFSVPPAPTHADALKAANELFTPFGHYKFENTRAGRALLLAVVLTAIERPFLPTAPMFAVRASMPGVGKGLLVRAVAKLAFNSVPVIATWGHSDEEFSKRLDALLLQCPAVVSIDNANGKQLRGDSLEAILSEGIADVRPLGRSETVRVRNRSLIIATGNNLIVTGDMARRVLVLDLVPKSAAPERDVYPFSPVEFVEKNRTSLLEASYTIMRAYRLARPTQNLPAVGSFDAWARRVRDPIAWLLDYDLSESFQRNKEEDPQRQDDAALLAALHSSYGSVEFKSGEVHAVYTAVANYKRNPHTHPKPTAQQEALHAAIENTIGSKDVTAKRIGQWAARQSGGYLAGFKLDVRRDKSLNVNCFTVKRL